MLRTRQPAKKRAKEIHIGQPGNPKPSPRLATINSVLTVV
jgi:hypothetical protein